MRGPAQISAASSLPLRLLGAASFLLTFVAMMGVGDAPDPHDHPSAIAEHFLSVGDTVVRSAPLGYLGAFGIVAFLLLLAGRLHGSRRPEATSGGTGAGIVRVTGILVGGYLAGLHLVYTALAYQVAEASPDATQALFVPTILAVPAIGALVAILLAAAAHTAHRARSMPGWWTILTAIGAVTASTALVSYGDSGWFSPDVQQQAVFNVLLLWVLLTAAALPRTVARARTGVLVRTIRRHPVGAFLAWFATLGQAIVFIPVIAPPTWELTSQPFIIVAGLVGLVLPALAITRMTDGPDGLRDFWRHAVRIAVPGRWYALAVIGVPAVITAIIIALFGTPDHTAGPVVAAALLSGYLLQVVVVFVTVNWWEEIAWMGFVQARLQARHGAMRAAAATGVLFGLGHISLVMDGSASETASLMGLLIVVSIPFRALQAWVHNRTGGSLVVVGLLHAAANAVAIGSILGEGVLPRLYDDAQRDPAGLVYPILAMIGLVVIAATRGRLGHRRHHRDPNVASTGAVSTPVHSHQSLTTS